MGCYRKNNFYVIGVLYTCHLTRCFSSELSSNDGALFNWTTVEGYSYMRNYDRVSWREAKESCERLNASLLDFNGAHDINYLQHENYSYSFWIGLRKNASGHTKIQGNVTNFSPTHCGIREASGNITRVSCDWYLAASICVKRKTEGTCDKNWVAHEETCSLVVYDRMTWLGAYAHCRRLNGELYKDGVHEASILNATQLRRIWTGWAASMTPNPHARWVWSDRTPLNWTEREIKVLDVGCYGCAFIDNQTLYLTSECSQNRYFKCVTEVLSHGDQDGLTTTPSVWESLQNTSWHDAERRCQSIPGNGQLLGYKYLDQASRAQSSWIGLERITEGRNACTVTTADHDTNITDWRRNKCYFVVCDNFSVPMIPYGPCNEQHHPVCIKEGNSCEHDWHQVKMTEQLACLKRSENLHMTWLAARQLCQQHGGRLLTFEDINSISWIPPSGRENNFCWVDYQDLYVPEDPLHGWQWLSGNEHNVTLWWEFFGKLRNTGEDLCGAMDFSKRTWEDVPCRRQSRRFICRKKMPNPVHLKDEKLQQEAIEVVASLCRTCLQKEPGNESGAKNVEELLSYFPLQLVQIVNASSSASYVIVENDFELAVDTFSLTDLPQMQVSRSSSIPIRSIQKLCNHSKSCTIKTVAVNIRNVMVNCSKWLETSSLQLADIISIDYIVDGQLVTELEDGETVSLNFSLKNKTEKSQVFCMFLDGVQWSDDGMNVGLVDHQGVQCITNHLSSFAMVVIDSESKDVHKAALKFINYIGCALSLTGLLLTTLVYVVLHKDLQILTTTRHLVHFNLQIALAFTQIVFLAGGTSTQKEVACKIVAVLLHYFSLASFCWMLLEAVMLYLKLISVYGGEFVRMRNFYAFGWGTPLIFVSLSAGLRFEAYGTSKWCWLSYDEGLFWVVFSPIILVALVTFVAVVAVGRVLIRAAKAQTNNKKYIISAARGIVILFPTLGLSWGFSIVAVNHSSVVWKYLFVITTSTQGFLIFLIYGICNTEIRNAISRRIGRDVFPTTTTT